MGLTNTEQEHNDVANRQHSHRNNGGKMLERRRRGNQK